MTLRPTAGPTGEVELVPEGTHLARLIWIVDIGLQDGMFGVKPQVILTYEFPKVRMETDEGDKPRVLSATLTMSINEKANLRKHVEALAGRSLTPAEEQDGFPLADLLGAPALVTVQHNHSTKHQRTFANIGVVSGLPDGMEAPNAENPLVAYEIPEQGKEETGEGWEHLPTWMQKRIQERMMTKAQKDEHVPLSEADIPFHPAPIGGWNL